MAKSNSVNLFATAKANPTAKAGKEKPVEVKLLTKGLDVYAQIDALEKQLDTLKKSVRPDIEAQMFKQFIANKGTNYKGEENKSTASLEFRKRASNVALKTEEIALLEQHKISTARIEGDFKLNVEGISPKKLQEVSNAISAIKGLPEDFISFDASKARTIVSETSIEEVFMINDIDVIQSLLPVVGVVAIKPKCSESLKVVLKTVSDIVLEIEKERAA